MEREDLEREDEMQLVRRLLAGETHALEQFVLSYERYITAVLRRQRNFCPEDVEELYQRFLLHIWEDSYRRLRPWSGTRSLRAYLAAVARNLAHDYRREVLRNSRAGDSREWSEEPSAECFQDARHASRRAGIVKSALEELTDRDREVIRRRYYCEESYREIAQAMGITVNHVGVALYRAESRLKIILQKHRGEL